MTTFTFPNFIIIGAAKAGTTSLWWYLHQHPQICLATVKEPRFFAYEGERINYLGPGDDKWARETTTTWESYRALFHPTSAHRAVGEASNVYLYFASKASRGIAERVPDAKLIAVLRHPVDRAYSNYLMLRGEGRESITDFREALREEKKRLAAGWSPGWAYTGRSFYADSIEIYLAAFHRSQMRFFLYEDWARTPQQVLRAIFQFLEVDPFRPDMSVRHNVSMIPRSRWLAFALHHRTPLSRILRRFLPKPAREAINRRLRIVNARRPDKLAPAVREELLPLFREDILRVSELIGRDLSPWLQTAY
jgi:hypothetical protein